MDAILAAVMRIVGIVTDIQARNAWIRDLLARGGSPVAEGSLLQELFTTYNLVVADNGLLASGSYGLAALAALISTARSDILAAIAALPAGSGLIIPTPSDNASAVWLATDPNSSPSNVYGNELWEPYSLALGRNVYEAFNAIYAPLFKAAGELSQNSVLNGMANYPHPDFANILPADTRLTWLTREETSFTWDDDGSGLIHGYYTVGPFPSPDWWFMLTEAAFQSLKTTLPFVGAPVWPGLAAVTLGTPVTLADGLVVAGPLHGVLVDCSTIPPGASSWNLGGMPAYYRWGEVSFVTDNGEAEEFQYLGFGLGVYCPKAMAVADSAIFRVQRLPTATVTPWLMV